MLEDEHKKRAARGYKECALPVVLYHNSPNNSVSPLWADSTGRRREGVESMNRRGASSRGTSDTTRIVRNAVSESFPYATQRGILTGPCALCIYFRTRDSARHAATPIRTILRLEERPRRRKDKSYEVLDRFFLELRASSSVEGASLGLFLTDFDVLSAQGPNVLGVLENLDLNYAGLRDIAGDPETQKRLLFRLLDSRVIQSVVKASLELCGRDSNEEPALVQFTPRSSDSERAFERMGGTSGDALRRECCGR